MIDLEIDCQTFLRLMGTNLGESDSGLYVVDPSGVRAWQEAPRHGELDTRWGRGHVGALRLDFIQAAVLPFPTTGHELLAWQKKNTEFSLPDWFQEVIAARDFGEAITGLTRSYSEHRERHDAKALELTHLKVAKKKPMEWYPVEVEINQQLGMLKAIEDITDQVKAARRDETRQALPSSPSVPSKMSAKQSGSKGGRVANAANRKVKEAVIADYRAAGYTDGEKNTAAVILAKKHNRSERTVRDYLKGL